MVADAVTTCLGFYMVTFMTALGFIATVTCESMWPYVVWWIVVAPLLLWMWPRDRRVTAAESAGA